MFLAAGIAKVYFQPDVRTATMIAFAIIVLTLVIKNTITDCVMEAIAIIVYAESKKELARIQIKLLQKMCIKQKPDPRGQVFL